MDTTSSTGRASLVPATTTLDGRRTLGTVALPVIARGGAFVLLARRMIPGFWFERGIGDLGQSLGVTATGLLLIKVADPKGKTPAMGPSGTSNWASSRSSAEAWSRPPRCR